MARKPKRWLFTAEVIEHVPEAEQRMALRSEEQLIIPARRRNLAFRVVADSPAVDKAAIAEALADDLLAQLRAGQVTLPGSTLDLCPVRVDEYRPKRRKPAAGGAKVDWHGEAERQAVAYARWLAARDGEMVPPVAADTRSTRPVVTWAETFNPHIRKHERRIRAVTFRNGARVTTIDLPHWDWCPAPAARREVDDAAPLSPLT